MTICFEQICRACLAENKPLISIWSTETSSSKSTKNENASIAVMFNAFTSSQASIDDKLPEKICLNCISEMNQAYSFKQKCERSEATLRSLLVQIQSNVAECQQEKIDKNTPQCEASESSAAQTQNNKVQSIFAQEQIYTEISDVDHVIYQCINCSHEFQTNDEFEQHLCNTQEATQITVEQTTTSNCQLDEKKPKIILSFNSVLSEGMNKKFICSHCKASFSGQRSLNLHVNSKKCLQQSYECDICHKVFVKKNYLIKHLRRMHHMNESSSSQMNEKMVQSSSKEKRKYKCHLCSKAFTMTSSLKDHLRIHTGDRPYLCSMCGKGFTQASNLRQHLMRHNQNKPFKCDKCSSAFVSKGELDSHDRTHTKEHPFVCEICHSGFTTSSSLVKHRRIHTGERPYGCDLCPLRFTAIGTLKNHRRTHTGEKPYQCGICSKSFSQRSDCLSHLKTHANKDNNK